jgi:hypothetical protein
MGYIVMFYTHTGAIKFDHKLKSQNIACELMPAPRKLSSSCGVAARITFDGILKDLVDDEVEKIFKVCSKQYELVYSAE